MKLNRRINSDRQLLFDGSSIDNILDRDFFNIEPLGSVFIPLKRYDNKIESLFKVISSVDKNKLINIEKLSNKPPEYLKAHLGDRFATLEYDFHYSDESIPVQWLVHANYLIIYCFGEIQPSRWILTIRSVWEVSNG